MSGDFGGTYQGKGVDKRGGENIAGCEMSEGLLIDLLPSVK